MTLTDDQRVQAVPNRFPHEAENGAVDEWFQQMHQLPARSAGPYRIALMALVIGPLPETIDYFVSAAAHSAKHSLGHPIACRGDDADDLD